MPIPYYLQKNLLSKRPNAHAGHVINSRSLYNDDLVKKMVLQGTTHTEADITGVMVLLTKTILEELENGHSIKLEFVKIKLSLGGVFDSISDDYDPNRHSLRATLTAGPALKDHLAKIKLTKVRRDVTVPSPEEYFDEISGLRNEIITPLRYATISGRGLKFNPTNPGEGIYFISEDGLQVVKTSKIHSATGQTLTFQAPELSAGTKWKIEVRRGYGRNGNIIRAGVLRDKLSTL